GDEPAAYEALHHANQLNPNDPGTVDLLYPVAMELAQKSQSAKQYEKAIRYLEDAGEVRDQEPEPHRRMAEVYTLTGDTVRATAEQKAADQLAKVSEPK